MKNTPRILLAALWMSATLCCATTRAHGSSSDSQELFKQVRTLYRANRNALRSVECDYTFFLDDIERRCRHAIEGDKYYHASVDLYKSGGRGLAQEAAWDGQVASCRRMAEFVTRSTRQDDALPACDVPERAIRHFVDDALGVSQRHAYRLVSAQRNHSDGREYIDLEYTADWSGGRLLARHGRDVGYLPVYVQYFDASGQLAFEMTRVDYAAREVDGNRIFYPVLIVQKVYLNGELADLMCYQVDQSTLRVNQPVVQTKFRLVPWPSDLVLDMNTGAEVKPTDPSWKPSAKQGFPWDVLFTPSIVRAQPPLVGMLPRHDVKFPAPPSAGGSTSWFAASKSWLIGGGVLLVVIGAATIVRARRGIA